MSWITENLNAGPWDFTKQPEKCGYVNNPRWTATPASEVIHEPCGYWPTGHTTSIANLYGITSSGGEIWAAYYDGTSLNWVSSYDSPDDANGLAFYNGNLLTVAGEGATAVLRELTVTAPLTVVANHTGMLANDLPSQGSTTTIINAASIEKYFVVGSAQGGRVIRFNSSLEREARGIYSTVVQGTDGHLYVLTESGFSWLAANRPVTGGNWNLYWDRIEDDICDSPLTPWGSGAFYPTYSGLTMALFHNGYLYFVLSQSTSQKALRKVDPATFEIVAAVDRTLAGHAVGYGNRIYVTVGSTTARVYAFSADDLTQVAVSDVLPYGRVTVGVGNGSLAVVGGRLVVTTIPFLTDSGLHVLDLDTLALIESIPYASSSSYGSLVGIDNSTVAIHEDNGVGIARLGGLAVPSGLGSSLEQATPPFLLFSSHGYGGGNDAWILSNTVTESSSSVVPAMPCGTSPVWPMTP